MAKKMKMKHRYFKIGERVFNCDYKHSDNFDFGVISQINGKPESQIVGVMKAFYREGKYCDCETSRIYKLYIIANRASYPARYLWKCRLRPMIAGIYKRLFRRRK